MGSPGRARARFPRPPVASTEAMRSAAGAPPSSSFSLSVEVDSSYREAKIVFLSELSGVEMIPEGWHSNSLPALLLEENKNEPVDTNARSWTLIAYDFLPCNTKYACLLIQGTTGTRNRLSTNQWKNLPNEASVVPGHCHLHTWAKGFENFSNHPTDYERLHSPRHGGQEGK
ncbi:hypothetical protein U9M48_005200, partial [Paspalum notatum var. saurae]